MTDPRGNSDHDTERALKEPSSAVLAYVENLIKQMNVAVKSLRLYPPNNPIPAQTISKFHSLLVEYLEAEGELRIGITKNGLTYESKIIGQHNEVLTNLALEFYTRGIGQIAFYVGVALQELSAFFSLINLDSYELKSRGGIATLIWDNNISNITVHELTTQIVEGEVEYVSSNSDVAEPEVILIDKLLKQRGVDPGERRVLLRLIGHKEQIKSFLTGLDKLRPGVTQGSADPTVDNLYKTIQKLGAVISEELLDEQPRLYRNLMEALSLLDKETRSHLFTKLASSAATEENALQLLRQLSPEELAEALVAVAKADIQAVDQLTESLRMLPGPGIDQQEFMNLLRQSLGAAGLDESLFESSVQAQDTTAPARLPLAEEPTEMLDLPILRVAAPLREFSQEEKRQIQAMAALDKRETMIHAVSTLVDLLYLVDNFERFSRIIDQIDELIPLLLQQGELALAANVLKSLRQLANLSAYPEYKEQIHLALSKAGSSQNVKLLVSALKALQPTDDQHSEILSYLALLNHKELAFTLLDNWSSEQSSMDRTVSDILAGIAQFELDILGDFVSDNRWHIVRDVTQILETLGNQDVLPYIEQILVHPDPRVHMAAVRALAANRSDGATDLLISLINHQEESIQLIATRALAASQNPRGIAALATMVKKRDLWGRSFTLQQEAIKALGAFDSDQALSVLEELLTRRVWFGRARDRVLKELACQVLEAKGTAEADEILRTTKHLSQHT